MSKYVRDKSHSKHEAYGKDEVYSKKDFAVITGKIKVQKETSNNIMSLENVDYPSGFNKDNCIPIAFGVEASFNMWDQRGINYDVVETREKYGKTILLDTDKIKIGFYVSEGVTQYSDQSVPYKIVLLKIA